MAAPSRHWRAKWMERGRGMGRGSRSRRRRGEEIGQERGERIRCREGVRE